MSKLLLLGRSSDPPHRSPDCCHCSHSPQKRSTLRPHQPRHRVCHNLEIPRPQLWSGKSKTLSLKWLNYLLGLSGRSRSQFGSNHLGYGIFHQLCSLPQMDKTEFQEDCRAAQCYFLGHKCSTWECNSHQRSDLQEWLLHRECHSQGLGTLLLRSWRQL